MPACILKDIKDKILVGALLHVDAVKSGLLLTGVDLVVNRENQNQKQGRHLEFA